MKAQEVCGKLGDEQAMVRVPDLIVEPARMHIFLTRDAKSFVKK